MAFEEILQTYIIPYLPAVTSVATIVWSGVKTIKTCREASTKDLTATQKLKAVMVNTTDIANRAMEENIELRKMCNNLQEATTVEIGKLKEELNSIRTANRELIQQNKELAAVKDDLAIIIQQNQALLNKGE